MGSLPVVACLIGDPRDRHRYLWTSGYHASHAAAARTGTVTPDFARAEGAYYGGLDEPAPQRGTVYLSANGIQFVWGKRVNLLGRIVGEEKQIAIRPEEIVDVATEVDRSPSFAATALLGVAGIGASKTTASLGWRSPTDAWLCLRSKGSPLRN